jgi:hypothetical protein
VPRNKQERWKCQPSPRNCPILAQDAVPPRNKTEAAAGEGRPNQALVMTEPVLGRATIAVRLLSLFMSPSSNRAVRAP